MEEDNTVEELVILMHEDINQIKFKLGITRAKGYKLVICIDPYTLDKFLCSKIDYFDFMKDKLLGFEYITLRGVKDFRILVDILGE